MARYTRNAQPTAIEGILKGWVRKHGLSREFLFHSIRTRWPELVGAAVARRTTPLSLSRGVLRVRVATSAWLNELSFVKAQLAERVNLGMGSDVVQRLHMVVGHVPASGEGSGFEPAERPPPPPPRLVISPAHEAEIRKEVPATVEDPDLREAIVKARVAQVLRQMRRAHDEANRRLARR